MMNIVAIIDKKSKGLSLTKEEINFFINGYIDGTIPDYQVSSLLMAIKLKGLQEEELINYARALVDSGETFPLREDYVDKHSTGGIGDKTSITLLPILGSMGLKVFKMSGRGLGFTGGTIDKLESITGFNAELDPSQVDKMVDEIGVSVTGQTPNLVPADGKIYALRDITATVDSKELIAASIISKKIASGAKNILIDMKVGTGAFVSTIEEAEELSRLMKIIADDYGRNLFVLYSTMEQPLGTSVGNKNEVVEAMEALEGKWSPDYKELIEKISTELYSKSKNVSIEEAKTKFKEVIEQGIAKEKQYEWFRKHGVTDVESATSFNPAFTTEVKSDKDGYVSFEDVKQFGNALIEIKAGRKVKGDSLDFDSGIIFNKKLGDEVKEGELLFTVTSSNEIPNSVIESIRSNIIINNDKKDSKVIIGELSW